MDRADEKRRSRDEIVQVPGGSMLTSAISSYLAQKGRLDTYSTGAELLEELSKLAGRREQILQLMELDFEGIFDENREALEVAAKELIKKAWNNAFDQIEITWPDHAKVKYDRLTESRGQLAFRITGLDLDVEVEGYYSLYIDSDSLISFRIGASQGEKVREMRVNVPIRSFKS